MTNEVAVIDNSLKAIVPAPPQKASDDQVATAGQNADKAIQTILKDPGDFETLAQLGNIGNTEQSAASAFLEERGVSVADMMNKLKDGQSNPLPDQIKELRNLMERFDPRPLRSKLKTAYEHEKTSGVVNWAMRKLGRIPVVGEVLQDMANKFTPIHTEIDGLITAMNGGLATLDANTAACIAQMKELDNLILLVNLKAFEAESITKALVDEAEKASDEAAKTKIIKAASMASSRALFLRGTENVYTQIESSVGLAIENNLKLKPIVQSLRDQARPLLTNLYFLITVTSDAKQIAEAAQDTQDMIADLTMASAEMTKETVESVGQAGLAMLGKIDQIVSAQKVLMEAIQRADDMAAEGLDAAQKALPAIKNATQELTNAVEGQKANIATDAITS